MFLRFSPHQRPMWCCCVKMFHSSSVYSNRFFTSLQSWRTNKHTYMTSTFRRNVAHMHALTERKFSLRVLISRRTRATSYWTHKDGGGLCLMESRHHNTSSPSLPSLRCSKTHHRRSSTGTAPHHRVHAVVFLQRIRHPSRRPRMHAAF